MQPGRDRGQVAVVLNGHPGLSGPTGEGGWRESLPSWLQFALSLKGLQCSVSWSPGRWPGAGHRQARPGGTDFWMLRLAAHMPRLPLLSGSPRLLEDRTFATCCPPAKILRAYICARWCHPPSLPGRAPDRAQGPGVSLALSGLTAGLNFVVTAVPDVSSAFTS